MLLGTRRREVGLGDRAEGECVVKSLEEGVGVRVGDVSFESRVACRVVEAEEEEGAESARAGWKGLEWTRHEPEVEVLDT